MNPIDPRPAQHQQAETVASLFALVKMQAHKVEMAGLEALDAAREAGRALTRAKELCPAGQWIATLEKFWPDSRFTAAKFMRVAQHWKKVRRCGSVHEALAWLTARGQPEGEKADLIPPGDDESVCPAGTGSAQDEAPQGEGEKGADKTGPDESPESPEDAALNEERARLADALRGKELVAGAMRSVLRARELLSEAWQTAAREKLKVAAVRQASMLTLQETDGIVRHGRTEGGVDVGIRLMTNPAMDLLIHMTAQVKYMLEVPEDESDERTGPERPDPGADDDAG